MVIDAHLAPILSGTARTGGNLIEVSTDDIPDPAYLVPTTDKPAQGISICWSSLLYNLLNFV